MYLTVINFLICCSQWGIFSEAGTTGTLCFSRRRLQLIGLRVGANHLLRCNAVNFIRTPPTFAEVYYHHLHDQRIIIEVKQEQTANIVLKMEAVHSTETSWTSSGLYCVTFQKI
jgi:hypothetical protein